MPFVEEGSNVNPNYENFLGLINEVTNYGFADGPQVYRGRIKGWLNKAQQRIARQVEAPEFQSVQTILTEQGVYKYALPENFLRTQDIYYPELQMRLRMCDLQQFDAMQHNAEGPPGMYTLYAKELWLFPTPNANEEELEHRYIHNPPWLIEDEDVPQLNPDYWDLLIEYAVSEAYRAEDDLEMAQAHRTLYKEELDAYATDVQDRFVDRPRVISGTWAESPTSGGNYRY